MRMGKILQCLFLLSSLAFFLAGFCFLSLAILSQGPPPRMFSFILSAVCLVLGILVLFLYSIARKRNLFL